MSRLTIFLVLCFVVSAMTTLVKKSSENQEFAISTDLVQEGQSGVVVRAKRYYGCGCGCGCATVAAVSVAPCGYGCCGCGYGK